MSAADTSATDMSAAAATGALRVLARARFPEPGDTEAPAVPGFVLSTFNPLVVEVAERCLRRVFATPPVEDARRAARIGVLLASASGDRETARALAEATSSARRVPPLLFFQSNPNAVLGYVAARWGLTGPVIALSPLTAPGAVTQSHTVIQDSAVIEDSLVAARSAATARMPADPLARALDEALEAAAVLIGDADAEAALVLAVEQGEAPEAQRPTAADRPAGDRAIAVFVAGER